MGVWVSFAIGLSVTILVGAVLVEVGSRRLKRRRREEAARRAAERARRLLETQRQRSRSKGNCKLPEWSIRFLPIWTLSN